MIATRFANPDATVDVWRFAVQQDIGRLLAVVSEDELRIAKRFAAAEHRASYLVQRAIMRCLLSPYVAIDPDAIVFARRPRGKPVIAGGAGVEFNLSHADDVALLAVSHTVTLGIDIERYDADLDLAALARVVLAPTEAYADRRGFLRIWCRKEACLKATGVGLLDDLTSVSVTTDRVEVTGTTVYVQDVLAGATHAAALATTTECAAISPIELETRVVTS